MSSAVRITSGAHRDINNALAWYDNEAPAQTARFLDHIDELVELLRHQPLTFPLTEEKARRGPVRGFPYQLWYIVDDVREDILVVALVHQRQNQSAFIGRTL